MKKTLVRTPKPQSGFQAISFRARLGGLALLALTVALSLAAARPAHTAGGPIAVTVANTPLATTPTTEPAFQPFQVQLDPSSTTSVVATASFTVPAGKRLVIETVSSAYDVADTGGSNGSLDLLTTAGGTTVPHYLASSYSTQDRQNLSVRYYADPGSKVTARAFGSHSSTGFVAGDVELSGYYVDVP